ncbi:MAG: DUF4168 domain-containing protein [Alkalispirochaeta sp.]
MLHRNMMIVAAIVIALSLVVVGTLPAQSEAQQGMQQSQEPVDPDSQEFERFVVALAAVQEVQAEINEEIEGTIAESDLGRDRFYEIYETMQSPDPSTQQNLDDSERESYEEIMEVVTEIQSDSQTDMVEAVEDNGLEVTRFNQIVVAIQNDDELQQAVQEQM